ncbi:MAG TPA: sulfurtransferase [Rhodobacteraceae bacterium]|nr:sulfurtransferase [Paracoccaceae bacterium]
MTRKTYTRLATEAAARITEIMPWDVPAFIATHPDALLLDIRERDEFARARVPGALNVPRGILESAAEWDYAETEPALVTARDKPVLIICRSGQRSAFAAERLIEMGFDDPRSVKLGIKGWNDADQPLERADGTALDGDDAIALIELQPRPDQREPDQRDPART